MVGAWSLASTFGACDGAVLVCQHLSSSCARAGLPWLLRSLWGALCSMCLKTRYMWHYLVLLSCSPRTR